MSKFLLLKNKQHLRRYLFTSVCLILIASFTFCLSEASSVEKVSFLCLNDFHAAVESGYIDWEGIKECIGGAVSLAGYVDRFRKKDPGLIWVVAGDMFMGHYLDSLTKGKAIIEFLNMIPPDCFTLGNHEFDYGIDHLRKRIDESEFPVICANIQTKDHKPFAKPYIIHETEGIKILFIGIICRNLSHIVSVTRLGDIKVTDPVDAILRWCNPLNQDVDLTVVLSHSGLDEDRRIAKRLPTESGVDMIIGSHSHDLMERPEAVNGIVICQAGSKGRYLGHMEVYLDPEKKQVKSYAWKLIPTLCDRITPHEKVKHWLAERTHTMAKRMEAVIGLLEGEWTREKEAYEWPIANFATDALAEEMNVNIGIYNRGGIRGSLKGPEIRLKDIWRIFPFGNYMVKFRLTGKQINILLERHLSGSGEYLFFSKALRYRFDPKKPARNRLLDATINGKSIDPDQRYTVATIDFLWGHSEKCFGLSQDEIKANGGFKTYQDLIDRDILIKHIRRARHLRARLDGRVKVGYHHID